VKSLGTGQFTLAVDISNFNSGSGRRFRGNRGGVGFGGGWVADRGGQNPRLGTQNVQTSPFGAWGDQRNCKKRRGVGGKKKCVGKFAHDVDS